MSTNNLPPNIPGSGAFGDLSAFEPEAILGALPGEHPRMAGALAIGRQAENSGSLDVAALSRIVNEMYAEGFPTHSPFAPTPFSQQADIPSNASLTDKVADGALPDVKTPGIKVPDINSTGAPASASGMPPVTALPGTAAPYYIPDTTVANLHASYLPALNGPALNGLALNRSIPAFQAGNIDINHLLGGIETPYQAELTQLLTGSQPSANVPLPANPLSANIENPSNYYFLQPHALPNTLKNAPFNTPNQAQNLAFTSAHPAFDVHSVRREFPILSETASGYPLIWFDNAATTQKPQVVIDRISYFYQHENSNIHRAAHALAARATDAYEEARETVRRFINAPSVDNIIFVRGTTEAINLVAKSWGKKHLSAGDEIVISHLEHHANIVPWQQLCQETGAVLKVAPVDDSGQILLNEYQQLLTPKVKLVSFTQVSNALGTVTPARQMTEMAHRIGAKVLLDGAQSVSHMATDVQALDADFFVFSGHKIFGPTGIGVLYGKPEMLEAMPPWQGGGNMIQDVTFEKTVYHGAPAKFEAGTGNIADAVGLGAALQYVEKIGIHNIAGYEHALLEYATAKMQEIPGLRLIGTAAEKASVLSFSYKAYQSEEVGATLNAKGIAVRSGHHCAQPILRRFGVETTVRPSLAFYNTYAEIDAMLQVLRSMN